MAECAEWVDDGGLSFVMLCNSVDCGHKVGPSQPMVCDCCEAKISAVLPIKVTYAERAPWMPPEGYKEGQCKCDCHDRNMRHIMACCDQTYVPRAEMVPHKPRPEPSIPSKENFMKFTMPTVRPEEKQ